jgi:hypothetical protein
MGMGLSIRRSVIEVDDASSRVMAPRTAGLAFMRAADRRDHPEDRTLPDA